MFDPWRVLATLPHVELVWAPLRGRLGQSNGHDKIWLEPDQYEVEQRCTLAHELVHMERGDKHACDPAVEKAVVEETARRLISMPDLIVAWQWASSLHDVADELHVTEDVLMDRLGVLTEREQARLADAVLRRGNPA
ncbi:hypothetical protein CLV28_0679 [Sediminihabitans luteus]|uniref:IrrE N-terminal-like domain-containing protein n=1 Tax=Sediminihabitans luteus TaxID=1138585 RepID=A0A2M9CZW6_9CELL|nr:ImmA/IrrE family metallo-endopeptidase [Sediminihabitans luteus]PJJ77460.1 hypothetical protein CLV28_0679 [Sediminihabitans luteus]GII98354.1 hypothetical protein Slu03_07320 [Sediminihabitans luteus]